jgi:trigger factor
LADALDLGSSGATRGGSNPPSRTDKTQETMLSYNIKDINDYTREISGEIPVEETEKHLNRIMQEIRRETAIPGFRKGKAPFSILKNFFGQQIKAQVTEEALQQHYVKIIEETKLHPITEPSLQEVTYEIGQPLKFRILIEVIVMDEPHDYKGVEVELPEVAVSEEEVVNFLSTLQARQGEFQVVENRPVKSGDILIVDAQAFDGEQEIGKFLREKSTLRVGENSYVENSSFDEQLIGLNRSDSKEIRLTFEADHADQTIAGKEILFKITVQEIKEMVLPELNDDFAASVGSYTTMAELRTAIESQQREQTMSRVRSDATEQIIDKVLELNPIVIPQSIIDSSIENLSKQFKLPEGQDWVEEEKKQKLGPIATRQLKRAYLLQTIAQKEKISVDDKTVREVYDGYKGYLSRGSRSKEDEESDLDNLRRNLLDTKIEQFLFDNAKKLGAGATALQEGTQTSDSTDENTLEHAQVRMEDEGAPPLSPPEQSP